jgi:hypothetical protein
VVQLFLSLSVKTLRLLLLALSILPVSWKKKRDRVTGEGNQRVSA